MKDVAGGAYILKSQGLPGSGDIRPGYATFSLTPGSPRLFMDMLSGVRCSDIGNGGWGFGGWHEPEVLCCWWVRVVCHTQGRICGCRLKKKPGSPRVRGLRGILGSVFPCGGAFRCFFGL
jgi:hypothetical protein